MLTARDKVNMSVTDYEKCIIESLADGKPLRTGELLHKIGLDPGGGELAYPMRRLLKRGIIKRHEIFQDDDELLHEGFVYELA